MSNSPFSSSTSSSISKNSTSTNVSFFKRPLLTAMVAALVASVSLTGCSAPNDSELDDTKKENNTADASSNVSKNDAVSVATIEVDTVKGDVSLPMNPSPLVVFHTQAVKQHYLQQTTHLYQMV